MRSPTATVFGVAVTAIDRSALPAGSVTDVATTARLLLALGSSDVEDASADAFTVAPRNAGTSTIIVTVANFPESTSPGEHVTTPSWSGFVHAPSLDVTERKRVPSGAVVLTVAPVAVLGPVLATAIRYTRRR